MKSEILLIASSDATGRYISVEDWIDTTVQVVSSDNDNRFQGNVFVEGTMDLDPATEQWTPLLNTSREAFLTLSGYSLAGLRAYTTGFTRGEVRILASAR